MSEAWDREAKQIRIRGLSGWRKGARENAVHDGIEAAARILAARGVDTRGVLSLREEAAKEVGEILAYIRGCGREPTEVPPAVPNPFPVTEDGQMPEDPRMATPEGRLELMKLALAAGKVEFADDDRGGFVVQWSSPRGFGEVTFHADECGLHCEDEMEGRMGVAAVLLALIEQARFTDDEPREGEPPKEPLQ